MYFNEKYRMLKTSGVFIVITPALMRRKTIISKLISYKFHVLMNHILDEVLEKDISSVYYCANALSKTKKDFKSIGFNMFSQIMFVASPGSIVLSQVTIYLEIFLTAILRKYSLRSNFRESLIVAYQKNLIQYRYIFL